MGKTGSSSGVPFLQRTPLSSSHRTSRLKHTKRRKGGEDVAVFFRGSCSRGSFNSPRLLEEDTRVLVEGLVVLKGDLTTASTERSLFFELLGGEVACRP